MRNCHRLYILIQRVRIARNAHGMTQPETPVGVSVLPHMHGTQEVSSLSLAILMLGFKLNINSLKRREWAVLGTRETHTLVK